VLKVKVVVETVQTKYVVPTIGPVRPVTSLNENVCPTRRPCEAEVVGALKDTVVGDNCTSDAKQSEFGVIWGDVNAPESAPTGPHDISAADDTNVAPIVITIADGVEHTKKTVEVRGATPPTVRPLAADTVNVIPGVKPCAAANVIVVPATAATIIGAPTRVAKNVVAVGTAVHTVADAATCKPPAVLKVKAWPVERPCTAAVETV